MSTSFGNNSGVQFANLGITSVATGITVTQTLYDLTSGQTTSTAFVPSPLNYVLGSVTSQLKSGGSYQTFTNCTLSFTTQSTRMVEIGLMVQTAGGGFIDFNGTAPDANVGYVRVLRGPSTIIGGANIIQFNLTPYPTGVTFFTYRTPASAWSWRDFSPPSGAATYILQAQTDGLSTQIGLNAVSMFVRQI